LNGGSDLTRDRLPNQDSLLGLYNDLVARTAQSGYQLIIAHILINDNIDRLPFLIDIDSVDTAAGS
jgi:hypothetical protein